MAKMDMNLVYAQHAEEVYHFLLRLCSDAHLAEDLLQNTFLKAIEKIDTFDNRCKLTSWLCQIAKNDYYDYLRIKLYFCAKAKFLYSGSLLTSLISVIKEGRV